MDDIWARYGVQIFNTVYFILTFNYTSLLQYITYAASDARARLRREARPQPVAPSLGEANFYLFQINASASFVGAIAACHIVRVHMPVDYTYTVWG